MTMGRTKSKKDVPHKSKLKKDPGIPRLPDLKVRVRNHQKRPQVPPERKSNPDSTMASEPTLSTLAQLASEAEASSSRLPEDPESSSNPSSLKDKTKEQLRKYYLKALHKVIDSSDIIILVLDARDPEGCRSRLVEEEVRRRESEGKKLVFVLNKIDLIPRGNAQQWLKFLRHSTPTLPFLSSSSQQHQRTNISSSTAPALLKLLKAYKPKAGSVTVGVVGYPNVGKSSLINSLKRSKVCAVAAQPGHTKDVQSIQLERGMRIIDSPGVVFDEDDFDDGKKTVDQKAGSVLLRNVVKVEDVEDPIAVVEEILVRTPKETLQKIYNLPEFASTLEFLTMLALNSGRLLKGGTPDLNSAARQVLTDWNQQKIPYYSTPPEIHPSLIPSTVPSSSTNANPDNAPTIAPGAEQVGQAQILGILSKPFELEGLFSAADAGAFGVRKTASGAGGGEGGDVHMHMDGDEDGDVFYDAVDDMPMDDDDDDANNQMESEDLVPRIPLKRARSRSPSPTSTMTTNSNSNHPHPPASTSSSLPPPLSNPHNNANATPEYASRQPKRQRKNRDVPAYDARPDDHVLERMERSNPLSRRTLKKEAKRVRRAHHRLIHSKEGGMEVDADADGVGGVLQFTFMA